MDSGQLRTIPDTFTAKQRALLDFWGGFPLRSQADIATLIKVKRRTITDWKHDNPAFAAEMERVRTDAIDRHCHEQHERLLSALPDVITSEIDLATTAASETVRHQAGVEIMDRTLGPVPRQTKQEISGPDGGPVRAEIAYYIPEKDAPLDPGSPPASE